MYTKKVIEHFTNPQNVGELENPDGIGKMGNPTCGDLMWVYIKVNPDTEIIEDIKVKTFGCAAAIATASMITELAKGKHVDEAYELSRSDVADSLDGLPPVKMHCSNLSADALHRAIDDYRNRKSQE